jgi:hypothetical protein
MAVVGGRATAAGDPKDREIMTVTASARTAAEPK